MSTKFSYPGHSKEVSDKKYACYSGHAFGPDCYSHEGSVARRLRRNGTFFDEGCPSVGCLTCFRTCAGACTGIRLLHRVCRRTLRIRSIIKVIVKAHPSYIDSRLLSCLRTLGQHAFMLMRCNVRDTGSRALGHVGHNRSFTYYQSTIRQARTEKVLANTRVVVNLPNRSTTRDLHRTPVVSSLPVSVLGVRRVRVVGKAHLTRRCTRRPFRICAIRRCVSIVMGCVQLLEGSLILRQFIDRSPGRLLITPG